MKSRLTLHALELDVFLGWPDAEHQHPQTVSVDIDITFAMPPASCISDDLQDTFSYDTLIAAIQTHTKSKTFRLLEHLAHALHQWLRQQLPVTTRVTVSVKKFPAIAALKGGASFRIGDSD